MEAERVANGGGEVLEI
jgi:5-methyltetrahydrofolate--homocysteine methyltransferase